VRYICAAHPVAGGKRSVFGRLNKSDARRDFVDTKTMEHLFPLFSFRLPTSKDNLFSGFDQEGKDSACALLVACEFTVLCRAKKSDKLELAFEVLDKKKNSQLSQDDMTNSTIVSHCSSKHRLFALA
jgi:Ca2+-binding EF-hand superfamily protein